MAVIDDQGRLFGKWNVVDAAVVGLLVLMIPVGYGAYGLFRTPVPKITKITPAQVTLKQTGRIEVTGENLRAFLRVRIGSQEGTLGLVSPTSAEIRLPDTLLPGTHDVALFDESREILRIPNALTVVAPPAPVAAAAPPPPPVPAPPGEAQVQVVGTFLSLTTADARRLRAHITLSRPEPQSDFDRTIARVLATKPIEPALQSVRVGPNEVVMAKMTTAVQVPAILRVRCVASGERCTVGNLAIEQPATLPLLLPAARPGQPDTIVAFRIDQVRAPDSALTFPPVGSAEIIVRARLLGTPDIVDRLKVGDVDQRGGATLIALDSKRTTLAGTSTANSIAIPQTYVAVEATVRVAAVYANAAWRYEGYPLRAGDAFAFNTLRYSIGGMIIEAQPPGTAAPKQ